MKNNFSHRLKWRSLHNVIQNEDHPISQIIKLNQTVWQLLVRSLKRWLFYRQNRIKQKISFYITFKIYTVFNQKLKMFGLLLDSRSETKLFHKFIVLNKSGQKCYYQRDTKRKTITFENEVAHMVLCKIRVLLLSSNIPILQTSFEFSND